MRRYDSVPHSGFGLGVERAVTWIAGVHHIREANPLPANVGVGVPVIRFWILSTPIYIEIRISNLCQDSYNMCRFLYAQELMICLIRYCLSNFDE